MRQVVFILILTLGLSAQLNAQWWWTWQGSKDTTIVTTSEVSSDLMITSDGDTMLTSEADTMKTAYLYDFNKHYNNGNQNEKDTIYNNPVFAVLSERKRTMAV